MAQVAAARPTTTQRRAAGGDAVKMVKLEAAGNDFLVLLVPAPGGGPVPFGPVRVRAVCDRRRGVGADGVLIGRPGGGAGSEAVDLEMQLYNADGSEAEMSGNGIRCLVHAAVRAGMVTAGVVRVATAAGLRTVAYEPGTDRPGAATEVWARVDMGRVRLGPEVASPLAGTRARLADVGNPHLVAIGDVALEEVDLGSLAAAAADAVGAPVNLEVVRPGRDGADLALRVFERGVGETLSCGTGSCAAAAVARDYRMVGDVVTVDNPGGRLEVRLGAGERPDAVVDGVELGGPVRTIADVEVDAAFFGAAGEDG
ncbi:MAG TPA: diaminopimelate epimerase [Acidimicrobiales bacterium]|nr:diaminopimelate epimerase [Acidimicrobiales bacterium]